MRFKISLKMALENNTNQSDIMIKNELITIILPSLFFSLIYTYLYNNIFKK
jgi:hypothetical protein